MITTVKKRKNIRNSITYTHKRTKHIHIYNHNKHFSLFFSVSFLRPPFFFLICILNKNQKPIKYGAILEV